MFLKYHDANIIVSWLLYQITQNDEITMINVTNRIFFQYMLTTGTECFNSKYEIIFYRS